MQKGDCIFSQGQGAFSSLGGHIPTRATFPPTGRGRPQGEIAKVGGGAKALTASLWDDTAFDPHLFCQNMHPSCVSPPYHQHQGTGANMREWCDLSALLQYSVGCGWFRGNGGKPKSGEASLASPALLRCLRQWPQLQRASDTALPADRGKDQPHQLLWCLS